MTQNNRLVEDPRIIQAGDNVMLLLRKRDIKDLQEIVATVIDAYAEAVNEDNDNDYPQYYLAKAILAAIKGEDPLNPGKPLIMSSEDVVDQCKLVAQIMRDTIGSGSKSEDLSDQYLANSLSGAEEGQAYEALHMAHHALNRFLGED